MIAVVLTARPSYAKLQPILAALVARHADVCVVGSASALLPRYGRVVDQVRIDHPTVRVVEVPSTLEGSTLQTAAKDAGVLLQSLADVFAGLAPDLVLVNHDRYEVLAATQAAAYQNIPVAHLGGGERSGNIDDHVRDAITALACYHFPATELARYRVLGLSGSERVWNLGCPSIDVAIAAQADPPVTLDAIGGSGAPLDLQRPFLLVLQHSETEQPDAAYAQLTSTLVACERAGLPALVIWPGADAGSDLASKAIRVRAVTAASYPLHTVRGLPPRQFLRLLRQTTVLVGNSSAGIREAGALGVPVVNIGRRQDGRQRCGNVIDVEHDPDAITAAITYQRGKLYPMSTIYGDGAAAPKIAETLLALTR